MVYAHGGGRELLGGEVVGSKAAYNAVGDSSVRM